MPNNETDDRTRICKSCNNQWEFTESEERFLRDKFGDDFAEPKRCIPCRKVKRESTDYQGNR